MSITRSLQLLAVSVGIVTACPSLLKRQDGTVTGTPGVPPLRYWAYEQSYDWGRQNPG
jgi:hypothetical protein